MVEFGEVAANAKEGAAAGLEDLALVDVERRLRIRVVVLAHRGREGGE